MDKFLQNKADTTVHVLISVRSPQTHEIQQSAQLHHCVIRGTLILVLCISTTKVGETRLGCSQRTHINSDLNDLDLHHADIMHNHMKILYTNTDTLSN